MELAALTVKNTFLDYEVDQPTSGSSRRSNSLPPAWRWSKDDDAASAATTAPASDGDDCETPTTVDCPVESSASGGEEAAVSCSPRTQQKTVLCLDEVINMDAKSKLSAKAKPFAPLDAPSAPEVHGLVGTLREALQGMCGVNSVKVTQGPLGGTTVVAAELARSAGPQAADALLRSTMLLAKAALLDAAAQSKSTYVLGYRAQPFRDIGAGSFRATLTSIDTQMQDSICWSSVEMGCCPRQGRCRWTHVPPASSLQVLVMLKEATR